MCASTCDRTWRLRCIHNIWTRREGDSLSVTELISEISQGGCTIADFFYLEVVAGCEGVQDPLRGPVAHRVIGLCENDRVQVERLIATGSERLAGRYPLKALPSSVLACLTIVALCRLRLVDRSKEGALRKAPRLALQRPIFGLPMCCMSDNTLLQQDTMFSEQPRTPQYWGYTKSPARAIAIRMTFADSFSTEAILHTAALL